MKKIFAIPILFILFAGITSAFNANLSVNKQYIDVNDTITLTLKLESDGSSQIAVKGIKGLEDFNIVGQNQMQSTSMQMVNINGKVKQSAVTTYNIILTLSPKKTGNFTIGPAIIQVGNKEYKTNKVDVKITGQKIILNNAKNTLNNLQNKSNIPTGKSYTLNQNSQNQNLQNQTIAQKYLLNDFKSQNIKVENTNNTIYFIIALFLLLGFAFVLFVLKKDKKQNSQDVFEKNENIEQNSNLEKDDENEVKTTNNSKLSFLTKYGIKSPETKTYTEIINYLKENNIKLTENEEKILQEEFLEKFRKN